MRTILLFLVFTGSALAAPDATPSVMTFDAATARGVNYCAAGGHHLEHWLHYSPAETARDLDYAKEIHVNQVRVFLSHAAYAADKAAFRRNLVDLARACQARHIGLMPVVTTKREMIDETEPYPRTRQWVRDLLAAIGEEPALVCWDVYNEPDYPDDPQRPIRTTQALVMARLFRELDPRRPRTPVTIGFAYEKYMEENADAVDVLSFHDYSPTRDEIRQHLDAAAAFAAKVKKPVVNTEIGCTARANPYDIAIEEYQRARVGFYIWELMITSYWGNVHGVFYPDGTVRDPAIAAAMLGIFRNRSAKVVPEFPDRERWVTRTVKNGRAWLGAPSGSYADGMRLAETAANLLEANQLVPMHDPPTRRVALLRAAPANGPALRDLLSRLLIELEPYARETR